MFLKGLESQWSKTCQRDQNQGGEFVLTASDRGSAIKS